MAETTPNDISASNDPNVIKSERATVTALLQTRTAKSGNQYQALAIRFENGYEKLIMLDRAELYLLKKS